VPQDVLAMSQIGRMGRFANQLIQYAFLRAYCRRHSLTPQAPAWIGKTLFGAEATRVDRSLPKFHDPNDKDRERALVPSLGEPLRNVDLVSYCQYHTSFYAPDRDYIRSLFVPRPRFRQPLDRALTQLRKHGETLVALHVRRGDFGSSFFYITPTDWYREWLSAIWPTLARPVLFIATDAPDEVLPAFEDYRPFTAQRLGVRFPKRLAFYPDFYLLGAADVLAIPNSTFSFAAAMLNPGLRALYRSQLTQPLRSPPFVRIDPWNADMLDISADVADFAGIEGISRPHQPTPRLRRRIIRSIKSSLGIT
jgi:hypothetical protein